ncbi:MAG: sulfurtransferase [Rhodobiaceae bacterium]|nr:sulfurtransferase [Rhodobiaceae bacterium]
MPKYLFNVISLFTILILTAINPVPAISGGCDHHEHTEASATPLVSSNWVYNKIQSGETTNNILLIDIRNSIGNGSYETYLQGHIPTSIHSDYMKDGWRVKVDNTVGLVPTESQFQELARSLGVNSDTHVVIIPAGVSSTDFGSATRSYWTFKVFGHDNVSILDGGYNSWKNAYPNQIATNAFSPRVDGNFTANFNPDLYISTEDVAKIVDSKSDMILLDGRPKNQFYAEAKHGKARAAGRLPGSVLLFQENAYNVVTNTLKPENELTEIFSDYLNEDVVSYCNTGHWAANNWFVLSEVLGNTKVKLYDGSMVEWTEDPARPLETSGPSNLDKLKDMIG